ncbi:MAG: hypothetical protein GX802_02430 [Clostridiales bacterium]|nr:hypothetical protein [Clostridiales bacterium]
MRRYVDDNGGRIQRNETILWQGETAKVRYFLKILLSLLIPFAVISGLLLLLRIIPNNEYTIPFLLMVGSPLIIIVPFAMLDVRAGFFCVTEKKILAEAKMHADKKMIFWFPYDEVIAFKINRTIIDCLFNIATIKVTVIHTWANPTTREIVRQSKGWIWIAGIRDAESCLAALNKGKELNAPNLPVS